MCYQLIDLDVTDAAHRSGKKLKPRRDESSIVSSSHLPAERMTNLERQMGMVMKTLTSISAEMSTFQKAVGNMDVLIRSVKDLQDTSIRSESRISASALVSGQASSTPSLSPGNRLGKSGRGTSESVSGSREILSLESPVTRRPKECDDLRVGRLVKAASETGHPFRVSCRILKH